MHENCIAEPQLKNYALGLLDDDSSAEIELHLSTCETCGSAVSSFDDASDSIMRSLRVKTSDAESPSWVERLANSPDPESLGNEPFGESSKSDIPSDPLSIGEYKMQQVIGRGGMSTVFSARHERLGRNVAFKVLRRPASSGRKAIERFCREMRLAGSLSHPAIVQVTDAGETDGIHYLVMEQVDGIDLSRLLYHTGPLKTADACRIAHDVADALSHAHHAGVIHRDIKPSNVMLDHFGNIKLLDFGLARLTSTTSEVTEHTTVGQLLGTLDYMAPEQANGDQVDERADIYSLGATLFRLLTGRPPHGRSSETPLLEFVRRLGSEDAPNLTEVRTDIPPQLAELAAKSLTMDHTSRIKSAAEFRDALKPFIGNSDLKSLASEFPTPTESYTSTPETNSNISDLHAAIAELSPRRAIALAEEQRQPANSIPPKTEPVSAGNGIYRWLLYLVPFIAGGLLWGVTIFLQTEKGTVRIDSEIDNVKVELIDESDAVVPLQVSRNGKESQIRTGRYKVTIAGDSHNLKITPDVITVSKGETKSITIIQSPKSMVASSPGDAPKTSVRSDSGSGFDTTQILHDVRTAADELDTDLEKMQRTYEGLTQLVFEQISLKQKIVRRKRDAELRLRTLESRIKLFTQNQKGLSKAEIEKLAIQFYDLYAIESASDNSPDSSSELMAAILDERELVRQGGDATELTKIRDRIRALKESALGSKTTEVNLAELYLNSQKQKIENLRDELKTTDDLIGRTNETTVDKAMDSKVLCANLADSLVVLRKLRTQLEKLQPNAFHLHSFGADSSRTWLLKNLDRLDVELNKKDAVYQELGNIFKTISMYEANAERLAQLEHTTRKHRSRHLAVKNRLEKGDTVEEVEMFVGRLQGLTETQIAKVQTGDPDPRVIETFLNFESHFAATCERAVTKTHAAMKSQAHSIREKVLRANVFEARRHWADARLPIATLEMAAYPTSAALQWTKANTQRSPLHAIASFAAATEKTRVDGNPVLVTVFATPKYADDAGEDAQFAKLRISLTGPKTPIVGEDFICTIRLTNEGQAVAKDVVIRSELASGLKHPGGRDLEYPVGQIAIGETKICKLPLTPTATGPTHVKHTVSANDGIEKRLQYPLIVKSSPTSEQTPVNSNSIADSLARTRMQEMQLKQKLGADHPQLLMVREKIKVMERFLADAARSNSGVPHASPLIEQASQSNLSHETGANGMTTVRSTSKHRATSQSNLKWDDRSEADSNGTSEADGTSQLGQKRLFDLKLERADLLQQFGPNHPKLVKINGQIDTLEKLMGGIPDEPVYKGKTLKHWEALLKYETNKEDRLEAATACVELMQLVAPAKQCELAIYSLQAMSAEQSQLCQLFLRFSIMSGSRSPRAAMIRERLNDIEDHSLLATHIAKMLKDPAWQEGAICALLLCKKQIDEHKEAWKETIEVARSIEQKADRPFSIGLNLVLPAEEARVNLVRHTTETKEIHDFYVALDVNELRDGLVSREDELTIAGRMTLSYPRIEWPGDINVKGLSEKNAGRQSAEEQREWTLYLQPIMGELKSHVSDIEKLTQSSDDNLYWRFLQFVENDFVGKSVQPEAERLLTTALGTLRERSDGMSSIGDSAESHMLSNVTRETIKALILLTGEFPAGAKPNSDAVLPKQLDAIAKDRTFPPKDLWNSHYRIAQMYPVEFIRASAKRRNWISTSTKKDLRESVLNNANILGQLHPIVVLAVLDAYGDEFESGAEEWNRCYAVIPPYSRQFETAIEHRPVIRKLFFQWLTRPTDNAKLKWDFVKSSITPTNDLIVFATKTIAEDAHQPAILGASDMLATWRKKQLVTASQFEKACKSATERPTSFFPSVLPLFLYSPKPGVEMAQNFIIQTVKRLEGKSVEELDHETDAFWGAIRIQPSPVSGAVRESLKKIRPQFKSDTGFARLIDEAISGEKEAEDTSSDGVQPVKAP